MRRAHGCRACGIRRWLYRFKPIVAFSVGCDDTKALKIRIEGRRIGIVRMCVAPSRIGLPDFDLCAANRFACAIQYPPHNVKNLALRAPYAIPHPGQVATLIRHCHDRVKRTQDLVLCPPEGGLRKDRTNRGKRAKSPDRGRHFQDVATA